MALFNRTKKEKNGGDIMSGYRWIVIILAGAMIVLGAISLVRIASNYGSYNAYINGYPILLISGILLLLMLKKSAGAIVLTASVFIALAGIIDTLMIMDYLPVTLSLLAIGFDVMMVVSAVSYSVGNIHNARRLVLLTLISMVTMVGNFLVTSSIEDVLALVVSGIFIFLLDQPGIREDSIGVKLREGIDALESVSISSSEVQVTESSLKCMLGEDRSSWTTFEDGPIDAEGQSEVLDGKIRYACTSRVWRGEDIVRISIIRDAKASTYGSGFDACSVSYTEENGCRYVHIFGEDGVFLKLKVVPDREEKKFRIIPRKSQDE